MGIEQHHLWLLGHSHDYRFSILLELVYHNVNTLPQERNNTCDGYFINNSQLGMGEAALTRLTVGGTREPAGRCAGRIDLFKCYLQSLF